MMTTCSMLTIAMIIKAMMMMLMMKMAMVMLMMKMMRMMRMMRMIVMRRMTMLMMTMMMEGAGQSTAAERWAMEELTGGGLEETGECNIEDGNIWYVAMAMVFSKILF